MSGFNTDACSSSCHHVLLLPNTAQCSGSTTLDGSCDSLEATSLDDPASCLDSNRASSPQQQQQQLLEVEPLKLHIVPPRRSWIFTTFLGPRRPLPLLPPASEPGALVDDSSDCDSDSECSTDCDLCELCNCDTDRLTDTSGYCSTESCSDEKQDNNDDAASSASCDLSCDEHDACCAVFKCARRRRRRERQQAQDSCPPQLVLRLSPGFCIDFEAELASMRKND